MHRVFFDQSLVDWPVATLLVEAQRVAAVGTLGEDGTERAGATQLVIGHTGEIRD
jgi:hypothetical protein